MTTCRRAIRDVVVSRMCRISKLRRGMNTVRITLWIKIVSYWRRLPAIFSNNGVSEERGMPMIKSEYPGRRAKRGRGLIAGRVSSQIWMPIRRGYRCRKRGRTSSAISWTSAWWTPSWAGPRPAAIRITKLSNSVSISKFRRKMPRIGSMAKSARIWISIR